MARGISCDGRSNQLKQRDELYLVLFLDSIQFFFYIFYARIYYYLYCKKCTLCICVCVFLITTTVSLSERLLLVVEVK